MVSSTMEPCRLKLISSEAGTTFEMKTSSDFRVPILKVRPLVGTDLSGVTTRSALRKPYQTQRSCCGVLSTENIGDRHTDLW